MGKSLSQDEFQKRFNDYTKGKVTLLSSYVNKKTKVKIKCNTCGYEWEISPVSILYPKDYSFRGCPECKYALCECEYCHKTFKRLKSELSEQNFCSRECGNRYKNINTTNLIDSLAYRRNAFNAYEHKCDICGWDKDERVMEVHHLDENRSNNHIDNLRILCPICHKYLTLHLYDYETLKEMFK